SEKLGPEALFLVYRSPPVGFLRQSVYRYPLLFPPVSLLGPAVAHPPQQVLFSLLVPLLEQVFPLLSLPSELPFEFFPLAGYPNRSYRRSSYQTHVAFHRP